MVKRFSDQSKLLILNVVEYFEKRKTYCESVGKSCVKVAAEALKVSEKTIYRLKKTTNSDAVYSDTMSRKVRDTKLKVNVVILNGLREMIYKMFAAKEHVTIKSLHQRFSEEMPDIVCTPRSINTWIHKIGFKFKTGCNRKFLCEHPSIRMKRIAFLRHYAEEKKLKNYKPVFLDETWIYSKGGNRKSWQDGTKATSSTKTGDGDRYIIVHAGSNEGFIKNASLIFKGNKKTGDYHNNMNQENFENWFKTQLIPSLEEPSLLIMDNASYHSRYVEVIPCLSWTKRRLIEWVKMKGVAYPENAMKNQIWEIVSRELPKKEYHLDKYAEEYGHKVLRTPPYHCQYNAIEMVWSQSKRFYDTEILKTHSSPEEVLQTWSRALDNVSNTQWNNYVRHTENTISLDWEREKQIDTSDMEPLIINTEESSDVSEDDSSLLDENEFY